MALFKIEQNKVRKIKSIQAEREKDIQKIFEENLETILNIYFLDTEYTTSFGGRIDTLGLDKDGSPVIIEYKKTQNENIVNQGLSYLKWLLDHKDSFEKLVSQKIPNTVYLRINWDSPRVICVAENYNRFDLDTVDILPIKIELLTYTIYESNILQIESQNYQKVRISTTGIIRNIRRERNISLQKIYTLDEHTKKANQNIKSLFSKLREMIISIDQDIKEEPQKYYIAYKLSTNFTDIEIQKNKLKVALNVKSGELKDPYSITRDMKNIGHFGNGDYELKISKSEELDKVFELIKQSYNYNK